MAYNPYLNYNPLYNGFTNPVMPQNNPNVMNNNQPVQQQQVQNGGVVIVQNAKEAQDYLVANGTSVTFIDMNGGADGLIPADGKRLCDNPTSGAGNAPA